MTLDSAVNSIRALCGLIAVGYISYLIHRYSRYQ